MRFTKIKPKDPLYSLSLQYKCPSDWRKMTGDERVRHCQACQKNVYNISKMSRQEAVELISEKEGNLCVRFYQRWDGKVVTQDCLSVLGMERAHTKYNPLAIINAALAFVWLVMMPMLGPAFVTIVQGVGPVMADPKRNYDQKADSSAEVYQEPASLPQDKSEIGENTNCFRDLVRWFGLRKKSSK